MLDQLNNLIEKEQKQKQLEQYTKEKPEYQQHQFTIFQLQNLQTELNKTPPTKALLAIQIAIALHEASHIEDSKNKALIMAAAGYDPRLSAEKDENTFNGKKVPQITSIAAALNQKDKDGSYTISDEEIIQNLNKANIGIQLPQPPKQTAGSDAQGKKQAQAVEADLVEQAKPKEDSTVFTGGASTSDVSPVKTVESSDTRKAGAPQGQPLQPGPTSPLAVLDVLTVITEVRALAQSHATQKSELIKAKIAEPKSSNPEEKETTRDLRAQQYALDTALARDLQGYELASVVLGEPDPNVGYTAAWEQTNELLTHRQSPTLNTLRAAISPDIHGLRTLARGGQANMMSSQAEPPSTKREEYGQNIYEQQGTQGQRTFAKYNRDNKEFYRPSLTLNPVSQPAEVQMEQTKFTLTHTGKYYGCLFNFDLGQAPQVDSIGEAYLYKLPSGESEFGYINLNDNNGFIAWLSSPTLQTTFVCHQTTGSNPKKTMVQGLNPPSVAINWNTINLDDRNYHFFKFVKGLHHPPSPQASSSSSAPQHLPAPQSDDTAKLIPEYGNDIHVYKSEQFQQRTFAKKGGNPSLILEPVSQFALKRMRQTDFTPTHTGNYYGGLFNLGDETQYPKIQGQAFLYNLPYDSQNRKFGNINLNNGGIIAWVSYPLYKETFVYYKKTGSAEPKNGFVWVDQILLSWDDIKNVPENNDFLTYFEQLPQSSSSAPPAPQPKRPQQPPQSVIAKQIPGTNFTIEITNEQETAAARMIQVLRVFDKSKQPPVRLSKYEIQVKTFHNLLQREDQANKDQFQIPNTQIWLNIADGSLKWVDLSQIQPSYKVLIENQSLKTVHIHPTEALTLATFVLTKIKSLKDKKKLEQATEVATTLDQYLKAVATEVKAEHPETAQRLETLANITGPIPLTFTDTLTDNDWGHVTTKPEYQLDEEAFEKSYNKLKEKKESLEELKTLAQQKNKQKKRAFKSRPR